MAADPALAAQPTDNTGAGQAATAVLDTLEVKGRAPKTGYKRTQFGKAWSDVDHNGCDTRNDILSRDLSGVKYKFGTHSCVVKSGTLQDPYTGKTIKFKRGQKTSTAVQIDHVVALSDAWQKGAQKLSKATRTELANDPYNLLAVQGKANQQKSDGDAATWLPSNKAFRCEYVARQIGVKHKYSLWVTSSEKAAMNRVLASCPTQTIPDYTGVKESSQQAQTDTSTQESTQENTQSQTQSQEDTQSQSQSTAPAPTTTQQDSGSSVYYKNCTAARAAGVAPIYQGQPGYRAALDRDRDGVACE
ncbi:GmrSD restriction endonuclease domain-containing protein [Bifidobacterium pongonis]|uniref:GmrSD restriction endonuclease domain-containing protein n=1 Tax=Bifidobacterium pongonis TaxID=2834432 RepID=UPI001F173AFF|nr:DUF1524 domain-containing protein [Bifidobacterium pongonis]